MRRRVYVTILAVLSILLAFPCFAFQNEPDGFRGIKWGEDISVRNNMDPIYADADKTVTSTRKVDNIFLGDVMLDSLTYRYWDGKFSGVFMRFRDADRFEKIKDICFEKFGIVKMHTSSPESYIWSGDKSFVNLNFDLIKDSGFLSIGSMRFLAEKLSFDKSKTKEAAEKGF